MTNKGKNTKLFKSRSRGTTQSHSHKHTMTETKNTQNLFKGKLLPPNLQCLEREGGGGEGSYIHKGLAGTVTYSAGRKKIK